MEKQYSLIVLDAEGEMQDIMDPRNGEALDELMTEDLDSAKSYYEELKHSYKDFSVKMLLK